MNVEAILAGCVIHRGRDIVVCAMQEAGASGRTSFHVLLGNDWFGYEEEPEWAAAGIAATQYAGTDEIVVVAVAPDGRTWELNPSTKVERLGRVAPGHAGVTRLASLSDVIWACGMGRLALWRDAAAQWHDVSAPKSTLADGVKGFTGIAEAAPGKQIAVGWAGEIWIRTAGTWHQQQSPSNSNFNAVSVGKDGEVVVVGDRGGLVVGREDQWRALALRGDFNLQGVCHFGGDVFVCSDFEIFRLVDDTLIRESRFAGESGPNTCMHLFAGGDAAFCLGERDLFRFAEGSWAKVL
jgi:hypothetical protein